MINELQIKKKTQRKSLRIMFDCSFIVKSVFKYWQYPLRLTSITRHKMDMGQTFRCCRIKSYFTSTLWQRRPRLFLRFHAPSANACSLSVIDSALLSPISYDLCQEMTEPCHCSTALSIAAIDSDEDRDSWLLLTRCIPVQL